MKQKKRTAKETSGKSSPTSTTAKVPRSVRFFDTTAGRFAGLVVGETINTLMLRYPAAVLERPVVDENSDHAIQRVSFNHLSLVDGEFYQLYKTAIRGEFRSENPAIVEAYDRYVTAYAGGLFQVNPYNKVEVTVTQGDAKAEPVSADAKLIPIHRDTRGDAPPQKEVVHQAHTGPVATVVTETSDGPSPS